MKIAFLGIKGLPSKGGAERVVEAIVGRMGGEHELTVYCNKRYTPEEAKVPGVKLIRVPSSSGVILFRISTLSPSMVAKKVIEVLESRTDWTGHFSVIEDTRIRMRTLPDR